MSSALGSDNVALGDVFTVLNDESRYSKLSPARNLQSSKARPAGIDSLDFFERYLLINA